LFFSVKGKTNADSKVILNLFKVENFVCKESLIRKAVFFYYLSRIQDKFFMSQKCIITIHGGRQAVDSSRTQTKDFFATEKKII
jgi:hypothetical protein